MHKINITKVTTGTLSGTLRTAGPWLFTFPE
jgi:hypothetical protein